MSPDRRRAVGAMVMMAGAAGAAHVGRPTVKLADRLGGIDLERAFPARFADWQIDPTIPVLLPAADVQAKLDAIYNQVLSRSYVSARGERVMLSVAYGGDQSDGMSIHLPEVCYPAQGFELRDKQAGELQLAGRRLPIHRLTTALGARIEQVTYWITIGEAVAPSRSRQKLIQIGYGLRGLIPDGMLVRISSIDRDASQAFQMQARFAQDLAAAIPDALAPRVLGRRGN
ncbi:EpsI family protein [Inhella inkyongensis]|uniref:EpsI family protein n=1 Tax=Inhella inkyongensis TaxID=392593 RepID=A0A840RZY2_9BURK|nr:exosortase-associated protein EpsI, B-type [Inhella inkyongensis]MBB5204357.1 EpsI family protein [Inhella inkyongensis]